MKVTLEPEHIVPLGLAEILIPAAAPVFTAILILLDITGEPVAQERLDVITHVIMSLLARVALV